MSDSPACGNCRFWLKNGQEEICRRFPPHVHFVPASASGATITMAQTISFFPGMQITGWCGEHEPLKAGVVITMVPGPGDGSLMK